MGFWAEEGKKAFVRRKFSAVTKRYDLVNALGSFGLDYWWRYRAAKELYPYSSPLLDLCAGTLTLSKELVRQRPRQVFALDLCFEMLDFGRFRFRHHPVSTFIFPVVGDGEKIPFKSDTFWGVSVAFGIRNLAHIPQGLKEIFRVLKPGGKLVILEFSWPQNFLFSRIYGVYCRQALTRLGGLLTGDEEAYRYLSSSIEQFPAPEKVAQMLEEAGFERVNYFPLSLGIVFIHTAKKPKETQDEGRQGPF